MSEIEKILTRFIQEMAVVDDTIQTLLRGHLLIEEALVRIIDQFVFHREHLTAARLTFAAKMQLCRALCLRKNSYGEWELIEALNSLRNVVAHALDSAQRERKFQKLKTIYMREAANMSNLNEISGRSDVDLLVLACGHCLGFLAHFETDARQFRQIVFNMDREINPDLPPFEL